MLGFIPKKIKLWSITSLVIIGALFYTLPSFLLQDQVLTMQFRNSLQKSLKGRGLNIQIGNIHWSGWGSFKCSKVSLIDTKQQLIPVQAERIDLSIDLLALLLNSRHFERSLRKVELINPSVSLQRYADGTWNFQKYFRKTNRKLSLDMVVIVKNGALALDDELYGKHNLTQINGKARFHQGESLDWECEGLSDFNQNFQWSSRGKAATNFKIGRGEVSVANLLLSEIAPYLSEYYAIKIFKGTGKIDIKFGWDYGKFWLINGTATLNDTRLKIPTLTKVLDIKELDGRILPSGFQINQAHIGYNGSSIKLSGSLNTKTTAIEGTISGARIRLADLNQFIPELKRRRFDGLANLKVTVSGDLDQPVLNGQISLNGMGIDLTKVLRAEGIIGQAKIVRNNLDIQKMKGLLGEASVEIKGEIANIFAPKYDLKISGEGLNPAELGLPELAGLKPGATFDFQGKVKGELWSPLITGEIQIDRLEYQELSAENLKAAIAWNVASKSVQISKLAGEIGEGSFSAEGAVKINPGGVEWKVSGELTGIELGSIKFASGLSLNGQISTHALLKGKWQPGEPFDPGLILGTFKGEGLTNQEIQLQEIQGVYSWEKNKLIVDSIQAGIGQGRIYGHLAWDTRVLTASFNAEHLALRALLPNVKKYPFDGIVDGSFEFEGPLSDLDGKIQGSIKQAAYLSKPVGEITCNLEYTGKGLKIISLQVASDTGDYSIDGGVDWTVEPTLDIRVSSDNLSMKGFRDWLPVSPSLLLGGIGTLKLELLGPLTNPAYTGEIRLDHPSLGNLRMERGTIQIEGDLREIRLNRVEFNDGLASLFISGKANHTELALLLAGRQINLDQLGLEYDGKKLQGRMDFEGKVAGSPFDPVLSLEILPGSLVFGPFAVDISSGNLTWKDQAIQLSQIKLNGEDFKVNIYGKIDLSQPLTVDLGFNVSDLNLAKLLQFFNASEIAATGKLGGLVKVTGNPFQPEIRVNGELSDATLSSVPLHGEFELDYHQNRLIIKRLKLWQNSGNLVADGVWEARSRLNLQVMTTGFSLETFNFLLPPGHRLAGTIDLDTNLAWSGSKISGELKAKVGEFHLNQNRLGNLQLVGEFTEQGIAIDESKLESKEGSVTARGHLPWPNQILSKMGKLNNSPYRLHLELVFKDAPVGMVNSYLPENIKVTSGSLNGFLNLEGAYGWPLFSGELVASHVGVETSLLPLPVAKARLAMDINHNKVFIKRARGEYGEGRFTLNGEVLLFGEEDQLHFNLNFKGSDLYYSNNYFDGFSDLNLLLTGTTNNSKLTGEINISEGKIGLLKMTQKGKPDVKWSPRFDLRVTTSKKVRYRQVGIADIPVRSDLRIRGDLKKPLISGEAVSNKGGVLTIYGQTFKVNRGKAVFKYSEGYYPYVDIESSVLTPKAEVYLTIKGQIGDDVAINLSSYPSLSEEDLFALLNWSELRGDKPLSIQGIANTNLSMVTDTVFGEVFYELRQALHLDYLYLEHDYTEDEFRISAGDYVSSRLFLSYSRSVTSLPKEKWGLDYHLTSHLTAGGTYSIEDGTSWRLTYRFRF